VIAGDPVTVVTMCLWLW